MMTFAADGRFAFTTFTIGVDGSYIKNGRMYSKSSSLWAAF
jgi:hypothetical protein